MNDLLYNILGIRLLCFEIILLCLYFPCIDYINKNRSKTNFIWRSLEKLEHEGILELNGNSRPKTYRLRLSGKINIAQLILSLKCKKK